MLQLLALIPGVLSLLTSVNEKWFDAKVKITQAKIGGDTTVATELVKAESAADAQRTTRLQAIAGSRVLVWLVVAFAAPLVIYEWQVIVIDIVWLRGQCGGHGQVPCTDPIRGMVGEWANTIIIAIFGATSGLALGSMYFNRRQ